MRVLITGATGLVGQHLVKLCLDADIEVSYLTTRKNKLESTPIFKGFLWNPDQGEIDTACFDNVDVIIHLAGASAAQRWTAKHKKEILDSRVETTKLLLASLQKVPHQVKKIVSASAIGIYPDSYQNYYTETFPEQDQGFLGQVVVEWEKAVSAFQEQGFDVAMLRIGLVLSDRGGAFPKIVKPIKSGVGAYFGNGKQWQSWIHVKDLARMFWFVADGEHTGVFNAVAPNPVSNKKMTKVIAKRLGKKIILPGIPRLVMRIVLGKMHQLLYSSQRVSSEKIEALGFEFVYKNIKKTIEDLIPAYTK